MKCYFGHASGNNATRIFWASSGLYSHRCLSFQGCAIQNLPRREGKWWVIQYIPTYLSCDVQSWSRIACVGTGRNEKFQIVSTSTLFWVYTELALYTRKQRVIAAYTARRGNIKSLPLSPLSSVSYPSCEMTTRACIPAVSFSVNCFASVSLVIVLCAEQWGTRWHRLLDCSFHSVHSDCSCWVQAHGNLLRSAVKWKVNFPRYRNFQYVFFQAPSSKWQHAFRTYCIYRYYWLWY